MSTYRLDRLFAPQSAALIGASPRPGSLGATVLRNLRAGQFPGPLYVVNPNHPEIDGVRTHASIGQLPTPVDVVIVTAPAPAVPAIIRQAGAKGCASAVILSAGLGHGAGSLSEQTRLAAREHGIRLVGPNCLGVLVPPAKLNASFARQLPAAGDLALISQSGAIAAGLVEWGSTRNIGFSAIVSLGDQIDADFADFLDYFALDRQTRAILMYVESIGDARKFMSAARAAARIKPVVVIKSGRHAQAAKAAATHTGALAGSDAVYEAAFHRAGLLRVLDLDELFSAAEMLGRVKPFDGKRLAILTNGGGIGVLAVDRLADLGGTLAEISPATLANMDGVLPPIWSHANPADIIGDADSARYRAAFGALLDDPANDAVLVMNVPTALAPAHDSAQAIAEMTAAYRERAFPPKPVLAVWLGEDPAATSAFDAAKIPHFATEADAIAGFMHAVRYSDAIRSLMETPPSLPEDFTPDKTKAERIIEKALADKRGWLNPVEVTGLLEAYGIPVAPALLAQSEDEAVSVAAPLLAQGTPVVVKILSPDITHKSEVGGVRLNLGSADAVRIAAREIMAQARKLRPDARIDGVTVHPMILRPKARELIAGLAEDPTFGPVLVFGRGGTAVEVINDKSLALPPLDMRLAQDLIGRTRVSRILKAYRDVPAADGEAIALTLVKLAQIAIDLPAVRELDLNPLLADQTGVLAVDARVAVKAPDTGRKRWRLAIRPYPKAWERRVALRDQSSVLLRPVRPEDEGLFEEFFRHVTAEDLRLRFFAPIRTFDHRFIARLTQIDYARAMCLVAIDPDSGGMLGAARLHSDANYETAEYAVLVRSDLKGRGLGWTLMQAIIEYARAEGLRSIHGQVLAENATMLAMCEQLGFSVEIDREEPGLRNVALDLATTS